VRAGDLLCDALAKFRRESLYSLELVVLLATPSLYSLELVVLLATLRLQFFDGLPQGFGFLEARGSPLVSHHDDDHEECEEAELATAEDSLLVAER